MMDNQLSDGVSIEEIDSEEMKKFQANHPGYDFVRFMPSGQVMPRCYTKTEKQMSELSVREDDVWVASFPKCGTTWTQEMVWNIVNNLDFKTAKSKSLDDRVPYAEMTGLLDEEIVGMFPNSFEQVDNLASPRVIKTHLSIDMLPKQIVGEKAKLVYVFRNPRDTVVSYYHWLVLDGFQGSFDVFFDAFVADVCGYYSPFLEHILGYWKKRNDEHICVISFEEMKKDLPTVIRQVSKFLNKNYSEAEISELADHLSFKSMKKNAQVNKADVVEALKMTGKGSFMRKGVTGDWMNYFSESQIERMDKWEKTQLAGSDLQFTYEV